MILLVTNERDITSDYVVLELQRRGLPCFRLNSERLPAGALSFAPSGAQEGWVFKCAPMSIAFSDVRAAYYRRPGSPRISPTIEGLAERQYCELEWNAAMFAALQSLEGRWLNSPTAISNSEDKPKQLQLARKVGFAIPDTVITNSPELARAFAENGPIVAKPLKTALMDSGENERVIFTTRIEALSRWPAESVAAAPMILQREIEKLFDIRATVVGKRVFAAEIHSQDDEETRTDWRKGTHTDLRHETHALPTAVEEMCIEVTRLCGLRFGAIDLILDRLGMYWFLELNPNGQWAWIENRTGLPITAAIVDELERIRGER